jgi:hypothetical protein
LDDPTKAEDSSNADDCLKATLFTKREEYVKGEVCVKNCVADITFVELNDLVPLKVLEAVI